MTEFDTFYYDEKFYINGTKEYRRRSQRKGFGFTLFVQAVLAALIFVVAWVSLTLGGGAKEICSEIIDIL